MTQCIVYDETTKESETFCSLTAAKKWMRERIKQKHEVSGQKYLSLIHILTLPTNREVDARAHQTEA